MCYVDPRCLSNFVHIYYYCVVCMISKSLLFVSLLNALFSSYVLHIGQLNLNLCYVDPRCLSNFFHIYYYCVVCMISKSLLFVSLLNALFASYCILHIGQLNLNFLICH